LWNPVLLKLKLKRNLLSAIRIEFDVMQCEGDCADVTSGWQIVTFVVASSWNRKAYLACCASQFYHWNYASVFSAD